MTTHLEIPYFPADVMRLLGIAHSNTLREYIKSGKVPQPDVQVSKKTRYWHRESLVTAGLLQPQASANLPTAATSPGAAAGIRPGYKVRELGRQAHGPVGAR